MPNRVLRDWTNSDRINAISVHAERFFTRLIMQADDFGRFHASPRLLSSYLFPLKDDMRDADITRCLTECEAAGLIVVYEASGKKYLQIVDFNQQLRQKNSKYPEPEQVNIMQAECKHNASRMIAGCKQDDSLKRNETETETKRNVIVGVTTDVRKMKSSYSELVNGLSGKSQKEVWEALKTFITENKPAFFEPYLDLWNVFAIKYGLIKEAQRSTDKRVRKFETRIREPEFDFLKILERIQSSSFARGNNSNGWKVTIEFILESQENYTKILEGKYE